MLTEYSKGFNAKVYLVTPEQKTLFPQAELVREDNSRDEWWFLRLFYRHKVASTLFPSNFIQVTGAQVEPKNVMIGVITIEGREVSRQLEPRVHRLFSRITKVLPEHAAFSSHIEGGYGMGKHSLCECSECCKHRQFHQEHSLAIKAKNVSNIMSQYGVVPPFIDPSDYCLDDQGNVVFFEIGNFKYRDTIAFLTLLQEVGNINPEEKQALVYSLRYRHLCDLSRKNLRAGLSELRIN